MSSISPASISSGLSTLVQKLGGKKKSSASSPASFLQGLLSPSSSTGLSGALGGLGKPKGGQNPLFKKIESAVSNALQSSSSSGSTSPGSTNANTIIQNAIASVLNDAADGAPVQEQDSPGTSNSAQTDSAFQQLLKANGVTPKQFQADFKSAVDQVQQGGIDVAKVFKSVPPGTLINITI